MTGGAREAIDALPPRRGLDPEPHAAALPADAAPLAALLRSSRIRSVSQRYQDDDREAREAQASFKRASEWANGCVLVTALCGAALVGIAAAAEGASNTALQVAYAVLGVGAVVASGASAVLFFQIRQGRLLEEWMSSRARAEGHRRDFFERVATTECGADTWQLEYFRRFLLEDQLAYYRAKRGKLRTAAKRTLLVGSIAAGLGSLATGMPGVLGGVGVVKLLPFAAFGLVASALATWVAAREGVNQSRQRSELFKRTRDGLQDLAADLDDVRAGVAAGNRELLVALVKAVSEVLAGEHASWVESGRRATDAIAKLRQAKEDVVIPSRAAQPKPAEEPAPAPVEAE